MAQKAQLWRKGRKRGRIGRRFLSAYFFMSNFDLRKPRREKDRSSFCKAKTFKIKQNKMKPIVLRKTKDGRLTTMPRKRVMMTAVFVEDAKVAEEDLSGLFPVVRKAEREMQTIRKKVSPDLFNLLMMQLQGFRGYMQYVMAMNITLFVFDHTVFTTGCASADMVLDICYAWIADEQGKLDSKLVELLKKVRV